MGYKYISIQYQHQSMLFVLNLIITAISLIVVRCQQCNNTHLQFLSQYSLGQLNQLNKTFTQINKTHLPIESLSHITVLSDVYTIHNMQISLMYRDGKQKAQIIDNDIIFIYGGVLDVIVTCDWSRRYKNNGSVINGTFRAIGVSEQVMFGKTLIIDKGFIIYQLAQVYRLNFFKKFDLIRVQPSTTSQQDRQILAYMMNQLTPTSGKQLITQTLNYNYSATLKKYLHDQKFKPQTEFNYTWQDPIKQKGVTVFNYSRMPTGILISRQGLTVTFTSKLLDFDKFKCGDYMIPAFGKNQSQYGGIQQYLSYTLFDNTIRFAQSKGLFNTKLNKNNWESRFFQFYAGDLYQVIPSISQQYSASEDVSGQCNSQLTNYFFKKGNQNDTFNVALQYACSLTIQNKKIAQFSLNIQFQIEGRPKYNRLDFYIVGFIFTPNFTNPVIQNHELAKTMIKHSLNRLMEQRIFGSGWHILERDFPYFRTEDKYAFIYDPTHIKDIQLQSD